MDTVPAFGIGNHVPTIGEPSWKNRPKCPRNGDSRTGRHDNLEFASGGRSSHGHGACLRVRSDSRDAGKSHRCQGKSVGYVHCVAYIQLHETGRPGKFIRTDSKSDRRTHQYHQTRASESVMGLDISTSDGQTPLDDDEKTGLLIPTITTRGELDEFEQLNIEEAMQWVLGKSFRTETILSEHFIRQLHQRMFRTVWNWAGDFRTTNKNIGVDKWQIPSDLRNLCGDALYWIEHATYPPDEIAIRFKHRLVSIHCFPNGNGRHSRLMADEGLIAPLLEFARS